MEPGPYLLELDKTYSVGSLFDPMLHPLIDSADRYMPDFSYSGDIAHHFTGPALPSEGPSSSTSGVLTLESVDFQHLASFPLTTSIVSDEEFANLMPRYGYVKTRPQAMPSVGYAPSQTADPRPEFAATSNTSGQFFDEAPAQTCHAAPEADMSIWSVPCSTVVVAESRSAVMMQPSLGNTPSLKIAAVTKCQTIRPPNTPPRRSPDLARLVRTEDEAARLARKRELNRLSAARARLREAQRIEDLRREVATQRALNLNLKRTVARLREAVSRLKQNCVCGAGGCHTL